MPWKFDPQTLDLVFVNITTQLVESGSLSFGDEFDSDLSLDAGDRLNESAQVDGGLRVVDGSI